eukprot:1889014-Karenia_brevis.AAC.1
MALQDAGDSPDRILLNQAVEELSQNDSATHTTEDTIEQDERMERLAERIATEPESSTGGTESILHLVQDEETIAELHQCVLPPDEYYDELRKLWQE